jgi:hypothetical protein
MQNKSPANRGVFYFIYNSSFPPADVLQIRIMLKYTIIRYIILKTAERER